MVARRVVDLVALVVRAGVLVVDLRVVDPRVVERREVLVPLERLASARALALRRDAVIFRPFSIEQGETTANRGDISYTLFSRNC